MSEFAASYDAMIFNPRMRELYGASDFYNVGDWSRGAATLPEACCHLVERVLQDEPSAPLRVLDAGCGLGAATELIAHHYSSGCVIGINLSERQAAHASKHHPPARYAAMDAARLAFPSGSFDRAVSIEAAFHFSSRARFLREAYRVLRPGGRLLIADLLFRTTEWIGSWSVPEVNALPDLRAYTRECALSGFEIESIDDLTACTWFGFCRLLDAHGENEFAERLRQSAHVYLLARLRK